MEAEIVLEYDEAKMSESVFKAISPDNFKVPKSLFIKTKRQGRRVVTHVKCEGRLGTFLATIDDLLFCTSTAEKALRVVKKFE